MRSKSKPFGVSGPRLARTEPKPKPANDMQASDEVTLEAMVHTLDTYVRTLNERGFPVTAHFVEIAALDLKCRVKGIAEHEIATLGLLARHVFERKWAARRIAKSSVGEN